MAMEILATASPIVTHSWEKSNGGVKAENEKPGNEKVEFGAGRFWLPGASRGLVGGLGIASFSVKFPFD